MGNQLTHRQPDNSLHSFTYDVMDRLDTASYAGEFVYHFDYTLTGMRDLITEQRNSVTTWTSDYAYDAQDRVTSVTTPNGTVSYTYDPNGNRASMTTPSGTTSYLYNGNDQLTQVTAPMGQTNLTYTNVGLPDTLTYPNGIVKDYSYDDRDRLNGVSYYPSTDPQYFLAAYNYTLDAAGNRTRVDELGGNYVEWDYDNAYRLTDETFYTSGGTPVYDANYTYDDTGNRLTETVDGQTTTYSYNALDQMTNAGTAQYDYDGRGNLEQITDGSDITTLDYDALDRLEDVILPNSTHLTYTYDPDGRRVQQVAGTQETNYLWDEYSAYGDVILETDGTGAALSSYTLAGTQLISQTRGGVTSYYLQDGQGSTRALTNGSGILTDAYSYTAFGTIYNQSGSTLNSYLYTGQQFDSLTGLYSLRARYYDPAVGRFLSQDTYPVNYQYPIELNRYGYVGGNPSNRYDPTGNVAAVNWVSQLAEIVKTVSIATLYGLTVAAMFCYTIYMISDLINQYIPVCGVEPTVREKSKEVDFDDELRKVQEGMKWPKLPDEKTCLKYTPICVALGWHLYDAVTNNNPQENGTEEQTQTETETENDPEACNPAAFEAWWGGLPEVHGNTAPNWYAWEQYWARGNGLYGDSPRHIDYGTGEIDADGIIPQKCWLVDTKYIESWENTRFRYNGAGNPNKDGWEGDTYKFLESEIKRYHAALQSGVVPGAGGLAIQVNSDRPEVTRFFRDLLRNAGFIMGVDGVVLTESHPAFIYFPNRRHVSNGRYVDPDVPPGYVYDNPRD